MRPCTDLDGQARATSGATCRRVAACSMVCPGQPASRPATARVSCSVRARPAPSCGRSRARPAARTSPLRQQAWRARSSAPRPRQAKRHSSRSGNALASRLPGPPVSTDSALPSHSVPRASVSSSRSSVADATAEASQAAGAKATRPSVAPINAPAAAQRPAAPRVRCQAISAKVDSAKPVRAKRAFPALAGAQSRTDDAHQASSVLGTSVSGLLMAPRCRSAAPRQCCRCSPARRA